ncbi:MAG: hypothetical protein U0168_25735 [Nannocystaceae bacterium]
MFASCPACFGEAPQDGGGSHASSTGSESGSSGDASSEGTGSSSTDPTLGDGSGDSSGSGCGDDCPEPGTAIWTLVEGGQGNDYAGGVAEVADGFVVVGSRATDGDSLPWTLGVSADGQMRWSESSGVALGPGNLRRVAAIGAWSVAVGQARSGDLELGYLEARDGDGVLSWSQSVTEQSYGVLLGVMPLGDGFRAFGLMSSRPGGGSSNSLLRDYVPTRPGQFEPDPAQVPEQLPAVELFAGQPLGNGLVVAVGLTRELDPPSAAIMVLDPDGTLHDQVYTHSGEGEQVFSSVVVRDDGVIVAAGHAFGASGSGGQLLLVRYGLGDDLVLEPLSETSWGDRPFAIANALAVDGNAVFVGAGVSDAAGASVTYDAAIMRYDGDASDPSWVVPYAQDSPGRDYVSDLLIASDGTLVACGVYSPDGDDVGDIWVRKLVP